MLQPWLLGVVGLLMGASLKLSAAELSRQALEAKYRGIKSFSAEATQTKTSPYLLKPLESKVKLSFKNERLSWQVEGQEPLEVQFEAGRMPRLMASAKGPALELPPAAESKLLETLSAVRDLILMDPRLDERFLLTVKKRELRIQAKTGESVFFKEIVLAFDSELSLHSMLFRAADDETRLSFSRVSVER